MVFPYMMPFPITMRCFMLFAITLAVTLLLVVFSMIRAVSSLVMLLAVMMTDVGSTIAMTMSHNWYGKITP